MGNCTALIHYLVASEDGTTIQASKICGSTSNLSTVFFIDMNYPTHIEVTQICKSCGDRKSDQVEDMGVFEKMTFTYDNLKRQRDSRQRNKARNIRIAKENDKYYDSSQDDQRIDHLKIELREMLWNECRYELCREKLSNLRQKNYSAVVISPNGKFRFALYFCSRAHWDIFRARCGLKPMAFSGQKTLEQTGVMPSNPR